MIQAARRMVVHRAVHQLANLVRRLRGAVYADTNSDLR
jgi:hypothetical protein